MLIVDTHAERQYRLLDTVSTHGGRVVKMIGDEVLFIVDDPLSAAAIALDLYGEVIALGRGTEQQ